VTTRRKPAAAESQGSAVTDPQDPAQLERDIQRTRQELGDTVEALAEKTDVKAQAKRKLDQTKASVSEKTEQLLDKAKEASPDSAATAATQASHVARDNPLALAAGAAFVFGFLIGRVTKR
jgi:ElaB/YqjD/DUF883 family membrane-anchored ribosome-binding protein